LAQLVKTVNKSSLKDKLHITVIAGALDSV